MVIRFFVQVTSLFTVWLLREVDERLACASSLTEVRVSVETGPSFGEERLGGASGLAGDLP